MYIIIIIKHIVTLYTIKKVNRLDLGKALRLPLPWINLNI